jgi:hypothetical protein
MIRRWLMNLHVDVWSFYKPVLEHALKDWQSEVANIILDGVMVGGGQRQILRLSLAHGQRAIPLGWVVVPGTGIPPVEKLEEMLTHVAEFLRLRVKTVNFLADRGFRDCDWAQLCQKLGWRYAIRTANNTFVTLKDVVTVVSVTHWGQAITWWPSAASVFHPAHLSRPIIGGKGQFCALVAQKPRGLDG